MSENTTNETDHGTPFVPMAITLRDYTPLQRAVNWAIEAERLHDYDMEQTISERARMLAAAMTAEDRANAGTAEEARRAHFQHLFDRTGTMANLWARIASAASVHTTEDTEDGDLTIGMIAGIMDLPDPRDAATGPCSCVDQH